MYPASPVPANGGTLVQPPRQRWGSVILFTTILKYDKRKS